MTEMHVIDWKRPDYTQVWADRMARLSNLRASPNLVPGVRAYYKDNPVAFINDWCCTFDPRNPEIGLPATVPFILFPKQAEYVEWVVARWRGREDGLVEKSRDMGLSWLSMAIAVWMWAHHQGVVVGFVKAF